MQGCMSAFGGMEPVELSQGLEQLKSEHPPLLERLESLYTLTQEIDKDLNSIGVFTQLITEVKEFIAELEPHSEREEGVLFRMMEKYTGIGTGPIAVMEYEHDQAKNYIATFLEKAVSEKTISEEDRKQYAVLIRNAYFTLTEHFAKEENVLFPMAEKMLSAEEKEELTRKIKKIE
jgi:regulator of cell morphogenesis and NO signaling